MKQRPNNGPQALAQDMWSLMGIIASFIAFPRQYALVFRGFQGAGPVFYFAGLPVRRPTAEKGSSADGSTVTKATSRVP